MESDALFNQKIYLTPSELNKVKTEKLDSILLIKLKETLEDKCSEHGYVIKNSISIVSRSLGEIENARFTGDFIFNVRAYGRVINAGEGIIISGTVVRKNKMGLLVDFKRAIQVQLPRDLHIGDPEFDKIEIGDVINVELRRSQFQIKDKFILANGIFKGTEDTDRYKDGIKMDRILGEDNTTPADLPVVPPEAPSEAPSEALPEAGEAGAGEAEAGEAEAGEAEEAEEAGEAEDDEAPPEAREAGDEDDEAEAGEVGGEDDEVEVED